MLKFEYTNQFKKDYKLMQKRNVNIDKLKIAMKSLIEEELLSSK